jgi:hypothetical protein
VIDSPADLARRLRRAGRAKLHATRYWAGWHLELTFGPYELAFAHDPDRLAWAKREAVKVYEQAGLPMPSDAEYTAQLEAQRGDWHLSASWCGGHSAEDGRRLLAELIEAMGVPADKRDGMQVAAHARARRAAEPAGHALDVEGDGMRPINVNRLAWVFNMAALHAGRLYREERDAEVAEIEAARAELEDYLAYHGKRVKLRTVRGAP